ncbi:hypothetical protein KJ633_07330, partial [bacterium]|nr:hypothetical protein [bacterium]
MRKILMQSALGITIILILSLLIYRHSHILFQAEKPVAKLIIDEGEVKRGDSLYTILTDKFSVRDSMALGNALSKVYNPKKMKQGDKYTIFCSTSGEVVKYIHRPS